MDAREVIEKFLDLQNKYASVRRALMTKERFCSVANKDQERGLDIEDEALNESLLEHVGHLPIMASFFYPYLENKSEIDLGRVMIMLSIHDIGETEVGDVFTYTKTQDEEDVEMQAANKLIPTELVPYFKEYEERETLDAKYAKAIDALAPLIREIDIPHYTFARFKKMGASVDDIISRKQSLFEWDKTLLEVFDLLIEQAKRVDSGEEFILKTKDYDLK